MIVILFNFFLLNLSLIYSQRTDYTQTIHSSNAPGEGTWRDAVYCPNDQYANGYKMRIDNSLFDKTALNSIEVSCKDPSTGSTSTINSYEGLWGSWNDYNYCGSDLFMIGYDLNKQSFLGATAIKGKCSDRTEFQAPGQSNNDVWIGWSSCPDSTAICGFKVRFQDYQGTDIDDTALNDVEFYCCRICDKTQARYLNGNVCVKCHYSCKSCSGGSDTQCSACYFTNTLSGGKCVSSNTIYEKAIEASPTGWTMSPALTSSNCGTTFTGIVGGPSVFGKTAYATKTYIDLPPHFKKRVIVGFIKIDSWDDEDSSLLLDAVSMGTKRFAYSDSWKYYGNQCGNSSYPETSAKLAFEAASETTTTTIKITTNLNSDATDESWGFEDFYLAVVRCHATCKSCNSGAQNDCKSCYTSATLQADKTCKCADGNFHETVTEPCSTPICAECKACYTGCKSCTGASMTQCTSCSSGFYFLTNQCLTDCGVGKYGKSSDNTCQPCTSPCAQCTTPNGPTVCTACSSPNYLNSGLCSSTCNSNQYKSDADRMCKACEPTCTTCSGPLNTNCLTCSGSLYLLGTQCTSDCGAGKYGATSTSTCTACTSPCYTCTTPNGPSTCTGCQSPYYLKASSCVTTCDSNQYPNDPDRKCYSCEPSCLTCNGGLSTNCLTCSSPKFLILTTNACLTTCLPETFAYTPTRKCILICTDPAVGNTNTWTCDGSCSTSQYLEQPSRRCKACESSCSTCSGGTSSNCLSCTGSLYLSGTQCLSDCGQGKYGKSSTNACDTCTAPCFTCTTPNGPTVCASCSSPYFLETSNCITKCSVGKWGNEGTRTCDLSCAYSNQYGDTNDRICKNCHASCKTCSGAGDHLCDSCELTSLLIWYYSVDKTCSSSCPDGSFIFDSTNKLCSQCHTDCKTCSAAGDHSCSSCNLSGSKAWYYSVAKTCTNVCPDGSFAADNTNKLCSTCHSDCKTCSGAGDHDCITCDQGSTKKWYYSVDKTCSTACSPGSFISDSSNYLCSKCNADCKTCYLGASNNCDSCDLASAKIWYYGVDHTCTAACPSGSYPADNTNKLCAKCHSDCKTCTGGGDHDCGSCDLASSKVWYYGIEKTCTATCPSGSFPSDSSNKLCSKCHSDCKTCSSNGDHACDSCDPSSEKIWYYPTDKTCSKNCPFGTFVSDNINKLCSKCHDDCDSCSALGNRNCESCDACGARSLKMWYFTNEKSCSSMCPSGTYVLNEPRKTCGKCHESCETCDGPGDHNCLSCDKCGVRSENSWYYANHKSCYLSCPSGTYPKDKTNKYCGKCHEDCEQCTGAGDHSCVSCDKCGTQSEKNWFFEDEKTCSSICPSGTYASNADQKLCARCHGNCKSCSGYGDHKCVTCDSCGVTSDKMWLLLQEGTCTTVCPKGTYAADLSHKECMKCHKDCESCVGPGNHNCLTCDKCGVVSLNTWFFDREKTCTESCPAGTYVSDEINKQCSKCHGSCKTCYGPGDHKCESCDACGVTSPLQWQYKIQNTCNSQCPDGTYAVDEAGKICAKCHENCETCEGPGDHNCLSCDKCGLRTDKIWFFGKEKSCSTTCPFGTYVRDNSKKLCEKCHDSCETCSGEGDHSCLTCDRCGLKSTKIWYIVEEKTCSSVCPSGTYISNSENKECTKCHGDCVSCTGPGDHKCTACDKCGVRSEKMWYFGEQQTCTPACPKGTFIFDGINKECGKCHESCESCSGPGDHNCATCDKCGIVSLKKWFYNTEKTCTDSCPAGTFVLDEANKYCSRCHSDCSTCSGPGDHSCDSCDKCGVSSLKVWYFSIQKVCNSQCPQGTYALDDTHKRCAKCHESCETCSGPGDHNCLTCDRCGFATEKIWYYAKEKTCTASCPAGTFSKDITTKLCEKCHENCVTCSGAGDHSCTSCDKCGLATEKVWHFVEEKTCTTACPSGTYISNFENKECTRCHGDCITCSGPGDHKCMTCDKCGVVSEKKWYFSEHQTCTLACPKGTFASDDLNKQCGRCHENCESCAGPGDHNCATCDKCGIVSLKKWFYNVEKTCTESCPVGTFIIDQASKYCSKCHNDCTICSGPGDHNCDACDNCGVSSLKIWRYPLQKVCISQCPEGTYALDEAHKICEKCHENCETCSGPGDHNCLTCDKCGFTTDKNWYYAKEKTCSASCPAGTFSKDKINKFCEKCHEDCVTCSGEGDHSCITCDKCGLASEKVWHFAEEKTCTTACPTGTYSNFENRECTRCHGDCITCSGPGDHKCMTCDKCGVISEKKWYFSEHQTCTLACPKGTFIFDEINKQCGRCHENCESCAGPGDHKCTTCDKCGIVSLKRWFYEAEKTCSESCPAGTFVLDETNKYCSRCHSDCTVCSGPGDHNCDACDNCGISSLKIWHYPLQKICITRCPDGTYALDDAHKKCTKCHESCETCSGPGDHNCITCDECGFTTDKIWYYAKDKTCTASCPAGTFSKDITTKLCEKCHENCVTCSGGGDHSCTSCDKCGLNTEKGWHFAEEKTCTTACPSGTYVSNFENKECMRCHGDCITCSGQGDHKCMTCDKCGVMSEKKWYFSEHQTCTASCPKGTFASNDLNKQCSKCHENCESCSGPGDHNCATCDKCGIASLKKWFHNSEKTCTHSCPVGSFVLDEANKYCQKCHNDCITCSGPGDHNCDTCDKCGVFSLKIWHYPLHKVCISQCPEGTYALDDTHKICARCHENCETCSGPGDHHCLTCDKCGLNTEKNWYYAKDKTCTASCPAGTFSKDKVNKFCEKCHEDCVTCSGEGSHSCITCDKCGLATEKVWQFVEEKTCTAACPSGTYISNFENKECTRCHGDCITCSGPGDHKCMTCDKCGIISEKKWYFSEHQTCTASCPKGTFASDDLNKQCGRCHENCESCAGPGDHNCATCDKCGIVSLKRWFFDAEKTCSESCPVGTFIIDEANKYCSRCHNDCITCSGPGDHNCDACDKCGIFSLKIWRYPLQKVCISQCPEGTYALDDTHKICERCHENCETCSGPGDHHCLTCDKCGLNTEKNWYYAKDKTCTASCPAGTFSKDKANKFCEKCHENCVTCSGEGDHSCITCDKCGLSTEKVWHFVEEKTCTAACPSGTYVSNFENKECTRCHGDCITCSGPGDHKCMTCDKCGVISEKKWYFSEHQTCTLACPKGTFIFDDINKQCGRCHENCESCSGPGDHNCATCDKCGIVSLKKWFYNTERTCTDSCPAGTFVLDEANKYCSKCHNDCITCSGPGDHNCDACDNCGVSSLKIWHYPLQKICISQCPEGTYALDNAHKFCARCHENCETCSGPGDHHCLTCDKCGLNTDKIWYYAKEKTCTASCPAGTFSKDLNNKYCEKCHENCDTCSGEGDHSCISCDKCGLYTERIWHFKEEKTCTTACPTGTFISNFENKECTRCHGDCVTCSGSGDHKCTTCDKCGLTSEKNWFFSEHQTCTQSCPKGTFVSDDINKQCVKCHENCESCYGPGDHNCMTCDKCGIVSPNKWFHNSEKTCTRSCPVGSFVLDEANKYCQKCHSDCITCSGPGDHSCDSCDRCGLSSLKIWHYSLQKICISQCPDGTYALDDAHKLCARCDESCETCSGPGDHNCLTCDKCSLITDKIWYYAKYKTCTASCPAGTYSKDIPNKLCEKCHENCETCSGAGDHYCLSCDKCAVSTEKAWFFSEEKTCYSSCPIGTYISNMLTKECDRCYKDCKTCSGPGDHNCLTCDWCGVISEKIWLFFEKRTCLSACPKGTYISDDIHKQCLKCHQDCESCTGPGDHSCIACDKCGVVSDRKWFYNSENTCSPTCPRGTYVSDESNKLCFKCHSDCASCSGPTDTNCDSCDKCGITTLNAWYYQPERICKALCPSGTYPADDSNRLCSKCHKDCETCRGPGDHNCLTCDKSGINTNKIWYYALERTCSSICPVGTFPKDSVNKLCEKCHGDCASCSGSGDHSCTGCERCGVDTDKIWYFADEKTCNSACPLGTFISNSLSRECARCHKDCITCFGPGDHNCNTCDKCGVVSDKNWFYYEQSTCTAICPFGTYAADHMNKKCLKCHENCESCAGVGDHNCITCDKCGIVSNTIWYYNDEKTCSQKCPRGTYISDESKKFCSRCHKDCETCSGPGDHSCDSCDKCGLASIISWHYEGEKLCLPQCPSGTYALDENNKKCAKCHQSCETCSGPGDHSCLTCDKCGINSNYIWHYAALKTCTTSCPSGTFAKDLVNKICEKCHGDCESCSGEGDHRCTTCDKCGLESEKSWFYKDQQTCTAMCPIGTYISNYFNKQCEKCHQDCKTCSGPGDHSCLACDYCGVVSVNIWYFQAERICTTSCPKGTFAADDSHKLCLKCHGDCETCFGPGDHNCISCDRCGIVNDKAWFYPQEKTCTSICPKGSYASDENKKYCSKCHVDCATCTGPGDHNCESCDKCGITSIKLWRFEKEKTCSSQCPRGTFAADDSNKLCLKCHDDCETCSGPGDHNCLSCEKCGVSTEKIWFYSKEKTCTASCPSGTYIKDNTNKYCEKCNGKCETCSGMGDHACLSCDTCGLTTDLMWYNEDEGTCNIKCLTGTYISNENTRKCKKCHKDCQTCSGKGDHKCNACDPCGIVTDKVWYFQEEMTCSSVCPKGTYAGGETEKTCIPCHQDCESCLGPGEHNCLSCDKCGMATNKIWYSSHQRTCTEICPKGTYISDYANKICSKCHTDCYTCSGPGDHHCDSCDRCTITSIKLWYYQTESTCSAHCPRGTFPLDETNRKCGKCHESCETCQGPGDHNCITCDRCGIRSDKSWYYPKDKTCTSTCPKGTFSIDLESNFCEKCHEDCETCSGPGNHNCLTCDACGLTTIKNWYYEQDKICSANCPLGTFVSNKYNKICTKCHKDCQDCVGPGNHNCLSCDKCGIQTLKIWYFSSDQTCAVSCPKGTYLADDVNKVCLPCHRDCESCSGPGDHSCLSCDKCGISTDKIWYFGEEKTCTSECPKGAYASDKENKSCSKCHKNCETCTGPGDHNCDSCDKCGVTSLNAWHSRVGRNCVPECPRGTYAVDPLGKICEKCHESCETCSGPGDHHCLSCDKCGIITVKGWYYAKEKTCTAVCPSGTFSKDVTNKYCEKCHENCETCTGAGDHSCLTCDKCGLTTEKNWYNEFDHTCSVSCPLGSFISNAINKKCSKCHKSCQTCSGSSDHECLTCDKCGMTTEKMWHFLEERTCSSVCPKGTYAADENNKFCERCHDDCESCFGPGDHSCFTCDKCGIVSEKIWFYGKEKTCSMTCPKGSYVSDEVNKLCANCHSDCETCFGPGDHNCESCDRCGTTSIKLYQYQPEKTCLSECPSGTYFVGGSVNQCRKCHESCETCSGPGEHHCLTCDKCGITGDKGWYFPKLMTCTSSCPRGTYSKDFKNKICEKCNDDCETCSDVGDHSCLTCDKCGVRTAKVWFYEHDKTCTVACPSGTYISDAVNRICTKCHSNCLTCDGPGEHNCILCDTCGTVLDRVWFFSNERTCNRLCPKGTYAGDNNNKNCIPCHKDCESCSGPGDHNCLSCDKCGITSIKMWYYDRERTCNILCPKGTFESDKINKFCSKCHENCHTCSGPGNHNCDTCDRCGTFSLAIWLYRKEKTCSSHCPIGTYVLDEVNKICEECHKSCVSCEGPGSHSCLTCDSCGITSSNVWFYENEKTCSSICPGGTYSLDESKKVCAKCHSSCETCSGPGDHECLTCDKCGVTNDKVWYHFDEKTCTAACPLRTFAFDPSNKYCRKCHGDCESCSGPSDHSCVTCDKCSVRSEKAWHFEDERTCSASCPAGTFIFDNVNKKCEKCHKDCQTCFGQSNNNCINCDKCGLTSVRSWFFSEEKTCYLECPLGTFASDNGNKICLKCNANCKTCLNSATFCTSCLPPLYLYFVTNTCVPGCASGLGGNNATRTCDTACALASQFIDASDKNICKDCSLNCKTCSNVASECTSCDSPNFLDKIAKTCVPQCPAPSWGVLTSRACEVKCPNSNEYGNAANLRICEVCNPNCKTCIDTSTKCMSCDPPLFLLNNLCISVCTAPTWGIVASRTCQASCTASNEYGDPADRVCKTCSNTCKTCETSSTKCTSCNPFTYLSANVCFSKCPDGLFGLTETNTCVKECPAGKYKDASENMCKVCPVPCKTCEPGLSKVDCLSCLNEYLFDSATKSCALGCPSPRAGNMTTMTCVSSCAGGYFAAGKNRLCGICSGKCLNCVESEDKCTSCRNGTFLFNNSCGASCPEGKVANSSSQICEDCIANCKACDTADKCSECLPGFYNFLKNASCIKCEGANLKISGKFCTECVDNCEVCDDNSQCTKCLADFELVNSTFCQKITFLNPDLQTTSYPNIFKFDFKQEALDYITKFTKIPKDYFEISIQGLNSNQFSFKLVDTGESYFHIQLAFGANVPMGSKVSLEIKPKDWMTQNSTKRLSKYSYEASLTKDFVYCQSNQIYNSTEKKCVDLILITPSLETDADPRIIKLRFDKDFPELFSILSEITSVSIDGLNSSQYTYNIFNTDNPREKKFIFTFNVSSTKSPNLMVQLNIPISLVNHPTMKLTATAVSIRMKSFFNLGAEELREIASSQQTTSAGGTVASATTGIASVASTGSTIMFRSLMLMELIKFMRFLEINYPPNALAVFEAKMDMLNFVPNINIERDPADPDPQGKFEVYKVDSYILNNLGSIISELVIVYLFAHFIKLINLNPDFLIKHQIIALIIYFLQRMFVWNFVFIVLLSNFQKLCVYSFVSIRWPSVYSTIGILNFCATIITCLVVLGAVAIVFTNIKKLRKTMAQVTPEKIPVLPPLLTKPLGVQLKKLNSLELEPDAINQNERIPDFMYSTPSNKKEKTLFEPTETSKSPSKEVPELRISESSAKRDNLTSKTEENKNDNENPDDHLSIEDDDDDSPASSSRDPPSKVRINKDEPFAFPFASKIPASKSNLIPETEEDGSKKKKSMNWGWDYRGSLLKTLEENPNPLFSTEKKERKKFDPGILDNTYAFNEDDLFPNKINAEQDKEVKDAEEDLSKMAEVRSGMFESIKKLFKREPPPPENNMESQERQNLVKENTIEPKDKKRPSSLKKSPNNRGSFFEKKVKVGSTQNLTEIMDNTSVETEGLRNYMKQQLAVEKSSKNNSELGKRNTLVIPGKRKTLPSIQENRKSIQENRKSVIKVTKLDLAHNFQTEPSNISPKYQSEEIVHQKTLNTDGAGNIKRVSFNRSPTKFRKESSMYNKPDGFFRRISQAFARKSIRVAPNTAEAVRRKSKLDAFRASLKASVPVVMTGNFIKRVSGIINKSSAFFKKDKSAQFKMNYLVLYKDFKQEKTRYSYYLVLDLLRHILLAATLVFLFQRPFEQIVIICSLNYFIMLYLIIVRPFNKLKDAIQNTVNELMVSTCCTACWYLAYLDKIGDEDNWKRMNAGWVIFYVNMVLMFFFTAIFFVELFFTLKELIPKGLKMIREKYRLSRQRKLAKKITDKNKSLNIQQSAVSKVEADRSENTYNSENTVQDKGEKPAQHNAEVRNIHLDNIVV